jgi:hypothetical protein
MTKSAFWIGLTAFALVLSGADPGAAKARYPVHRIRDLWPALATCWQPPLNSGGMELTVRFSLNRDGALMGEPRVTYSRLHGSAEEQRSFRDSVLRAVLDCTPLPITDEFGMYFAGRPFSVRFIGREGVCSPAMCPRVRTIEG